MKISYTPSKSESSSSLVTEREANAVSEPNNESAPPEAARRITTERSDIYPTVGRDSLEDVIGMNTDTLEYSRLSVLVTNSEHGPSTLQSRSIPISDHIAGSEPNGGKQTTILAQPHLLSQTAYDWLTQVMKWMKWI